MAYDEKLAARIRKIVGKKKGVTERKMFGGLAFMLRGRMFCGVLKNDAVLRVGPKNYEKFASMPYARPMDFTGRPMKGFVYVGPKGCAGKSLNRLVDACLYYVSGKK